MQTHQTKTPRDADTLMRDQMLVKHLAGSHAYGTAMETSDVDYRGVFCADPINIRTPFFTVKEATDVKEEDTKLFELSHFMKLCLDCNPNVVETLWVDDSHITHTTSAYSMLREARHALLSSKIAFTTSGYALAQLKRIKGHNKWINNPQNENPPLPYQYLSVVEWFGKEQNNKPSIKDFYTDHRLVPYGGDLYGVVPANSHQLWDQFGRLNEILDDDHRHSLPYPIMIVKWNRHVYKTAKETHESYWSWKTNRNKSRGELEEQFGYDTKHAMHLVRLLRMGLEALQDGELNVFRSDADELLAIRNGAWTYEEIVEYAEQMDNHIRSFWYMKTDLRKKPDIKFAANLLMDVQDIVWSCG